MMVFWIILGGAAGINITQSIWRFVGFSIGEVAIAVPVGGVVGALAGALLGLIRNPRSLVLLMAVFAGSAAGAVAGKLPWGDVGEIGGQLAGGLVGGLAWAAWLFLGRGYVSELHDPSGPVGGQTGAGRSRESSGEKLRAEEGSMPCSAAGRFPSPHG
jgi:hypothetical protein